MSIQAVAAASAAAINPVRAATHAVLALPPGRHRADNRIVMAPMTRSRALDGNVPNPLAATYYAQRASAGLIITEATQVSPQGVGYIRTPGIHSPEQVAGWQHDHRRRASRRAARSSRSSGTSAASRIRISTAAPAGRPVRVAGRRRSLHHQRQGQDRDAARARDRRDPRHRRAIPQGARRMPRPRASTASSCTAPTATCSTSSCATAPTAAPTPTAAASRTACGLPLEVAEAVAGVWGAGARRLQALALFPGLLDVGLQSGRDLHLSSRRSSASCGLGYLHVSEAIAGPMAGRRDRARDAASCAMRSTAR